MTTAQSYGGIFLNWGSFLSDDSSLSQADIKLANTGSKGIRVHRDRKTQQQAASTAAGTGSLVTSSNPSLKLRETGLEVGETMKAQSPSHSDIFPLARLQLPKVPQPPQTTNNWGLDVQILKSMKVISLIQTTTPINREQMHLQKTINLCDEYYLAIKMDEILMHTVTWMSPEKV